VLVDDLKRHVRERFASDATNGGSPASGIPGMPPVDHAAFGPIREEKLTRIQKVSGPVLHRSWLNVPHVTQHDEADVTLLERFRRDRREAAAERGLKLSPLLFVMKAVVIALKEYPTLRSSLSSNQDHLVIKEYFHLGIAVDTDQGLVVPVIRDVDRKGIFELAAEVSATAERARKRKLGPDDLRGACFTISSLGGIGGTAFTPIVNAPEVAILGLSKTRVQPLWQGPSPLDLMESTAGAGVRRTEITRPSIAVDPAGGADPPPSGHFVPRLVLPFSLSYDHRVIDGALAARFTSRLSRLLSNPMQQLL
jgi:pyruvate dehydrogenase E2 component (dihydrolipoamide acetyltransferase)